MRIVLMVCLVLAGCGPRGDFVARPPDDGRTVRTIILADHVDGAVSLNRIEVSIPPGRSLGQVDFTGEGAFGVAETSTLDGAAFLREVAATGPPGAPVTVFVHGYNNTRAEAVYRHAQIAQDFDEDGAQITFAWPSVANPLGYVADRDGALRARDTLAGLLTLLATRQDRPILLVAHSMGGFLAMETLRQLALSDDLPRGRFESVILISPDIDIDVFKAQAETIGRLPDPFVVTVSRQDRILGLSQRLAGSRPRLGSARDLRVLADLDITVVDLSDAQGGRAGGHLQAVTSPEAIRWLRGVSRSGDVLREPSGIELLVPFGTGLVTDVIGATN
jgi:esterase/lipase superfamily enzyme